MHRVAEPGPALPAALRAAPGAAVAKLIDSMSPCCRWCSRTPGCRTASAWRFIMACPGADEHAIRGAEQGLRGPQHDHFDEPHHLQRGLLPDTRCSSRCPLSPAFDNPGCAYASGVTGGMAASGQRPDHFADDAREHVLWPHRMPTPTLRCWRALSPAELGRSPAHRGDLMADTRIWFEAPMPAPPPRRDHPARHAAASGHSPTDDGPTFDPELARRRRRCSVNRHLDLWRRRRPLARTPATASDGLAETLASTLYCAWRSSCGLQQQQHAPDPAGIFPQPEQRFRRHVDPRHRRLGLAPATVDLSAARDNSGTPLLDAAITVADASAWNLIVGRSGRRVTGRGTSRTGPPAFEASADAATWAHLANTSGGTNIPVDRQQQQLVPLAPATLPARSWLTSPIPTPRWPPTSPRDPRGAGVRPQHHRLAARLPAEPTRPPGIARRVFRFEAHPWQHRPSMPSRPRRRLGTGTLTLIAPAASHRSFPGRGATRPSWSATASTTAAATNGASALVDGGSPGTLNRTTIIASSNGGSAVSLPASATFCVPVLDAQGARPVHRHRVGQRHDGYAGSAEYVWTGSGDGTFTPGGGGQLPEGLAEILFRNHCTAVLTLDGNAAPRRSTVSRR